MENQDMRNSQAGPPNDVGKRVQQLSLETARAQESAARALSQTEKMRWDMEEFRGATQGRGRGLTGLWGGFAILVLTVNGLAWYGYEAARGYDERFANLPDYAQTIQAVNDRVNEQTAATDSKLESWAGEWKGLRDRLAKFEQRVASDFRMLRSFAQEQAQQHANEVQRQLTAEIDNRTEWLQMRMTRMESTQESQRARIAGLQEELARVRAEQNEQLALLRRDTHREMDGLQERLTATRGDLDALAWESARQRVEFEVRREQAFEPIPGLTITLQNTNVPYQRVEEGWVHVVPEGRILWIRSQGIQQPMIFYTQGDSRPYELVFTQLTQDGAVGYLVHPGGPPVAAGALGPLAGEGEELSASASEAR